MAREPERVPRIRPSWRVPVAVMALALVLLALTALAGCDQKKPGADGYQFARKEWVVLDLHIKLVLHPSLEDLRAEAKRAGIEVGPDEKLMGWGIVSKTGFCTSHIVDPFVLWLPEFLGHEVGHCAFGRFHGLPVR